jgi:hypothetical protein
MRQVIITNMFDIDHHQRNQRDLEKSEGDCSNVLNTTEETA